MRDRSFVIFCAALTIAASAAGPARAACRIEDFREVQYVVCAFDPAQDDIRLFLNGANGAPFGDFAAIEAALAQNGESERLVFAMNAGMYHKDRSPVGLYVERGEEKKKLSTRDGPGNFHLKPNGVFWTDKTGAHVASAEAYEAADKVELRDATQSGPMLVIDGALHPKFLADGTSRKRRNGVGVTKDGAAVFAISDGFVNFYDFATFFRDRLGAVNALYLDGTISRVYAPELDRKEGGLPMGPILGVVEKTPG